MGNDVDEGICSYLTSIVLRHTKTPYYGNLWEILPTTPTKRYTYLDTHNHPHIP